MKDDNISVLIECIKKYLPEMEAIYSEDDLTNVTTKFIMGEFVREKILELTHDEIPHTVTCYVENYEEDEKTEPNVSDGGKGGSDGSSNSTSM